MCRGAVVGVRRLGGWWDAEVVRGSEAGARGGECSLRLLPSGRPCTSQPAGLRPAWAWQQGGWHVCETAAQLASHLAAGGLLLSARPTAEAEEEAGREAEVEG